jgi:hypothetical protein
VVQTTPNISHQFPNAGLYHVKLVVTDLRGKVSDNTAHQIIAVDQPLGLVSVVSRLSHGAAGEFDTDLPLTGNVGVECRASANSNYQLVYTFNKNVSVPGTASKANGTATVGAPALGPNANQVTVPLSGVTNAQQVAITLNGVQNTVGEIANNATAQMAVLVGDTNADGAVNSADISQTKSQSGQAVTSLNYREDLNADGSINSADISLVKSKSGTGFTTTTTASVSTPDATSAPQTTATESTQPSDTRKIKHRARDREPRQ